MPFWKPSSRKLPRSEPFARVIVPAAASIVIGPLKACDAWSPPTCSNVIRVASKSGDDKSMSVWPSVISAIVDRARRRRAGQPQLVGVALLRMRRAVRRQGAVVVAAGHDERRAVARQATKTPGFSSSITSASTRSTIFAALYAASVSRRVDRVLDRRVVRILAARSRCARARHDHRHEPVAAVELGGSRRSRSRGTRSGRSESTNGSVEWKRASLLVRQTRVSPETSFSSILTTTVPVGALASRCCTCRAARSSDASGRRRIAPALERDVVVVGVARVRVELRRARTSGWSLS